MRQQGARPLRRGEGGGGVRMRKLVAPLFMPADGDVEAPGRFLRAGLDRDPDAFNDETAGGEDPAP